MIATIISTIFGFWRAKETNHTKRRILLTIILLMILVPAILFL